MNNEVQKKTEAEFVEMLKQEYFEIQSITENISELKERIKSAGYDAALLNKVAKTMVDNKVDEVLDKNSAFEALVEKVRNS